MMGDACPQDMEPICPNNAMGRMAGGAGDGHMADKGKKDYIGVIK